MLYKLRKTINKAAPPLAVTGLKTPPFFHSKIPVKSEEVRRRKEEGRKTRFSCDVQDDAKHWDAAKMFYWCCLALIAL